MIRFLALALGLLIGTVAAPLAWAAESREVSGTLTYKQKIALPPDARAVIRAEGRFGVTLGKIALDDGGLQMPRSFAFRVPSGLSGHIRALITVNGAPRWIIDGVPFTAGSGPVAMGEMFLKPVSPLAFATEFLCGDTRVSVGMLGDEAVLRAEGHDIPLTRIETASGARYDGVNGPATNVWTKGDTVMVRLGGRDLPDCHKVLPPEDRPYRARGNEPGWHVLLNDDTAGIVADYGAITREVPRPAAQAEPGGYAFDLSGANARLRIEEQMCHDDATGMPFPDTAQLVLDDRVLRGCGGDSVDLLTGGAWRISALGDAPLIEPERLSLNFLDAGRVAGSGGCNRLVGGFNLSGEGLHFGPMASTMMACPEPLMEQERRMLDTLEQVIAFDVDARGRLLLLAEDRRSVLIEAARP